jgi:hypothetical protein
VDGCGHVGVTALDERDEPAFEGSTFEQHVPATTLAAHADVGTESIDQPITSAARMGFAESDDISEQQLEHATVTHRRRAYQTSGRP